MTGRKLPRPGTKANSARIKARQEADIALIEAGAFDDLGVPLTTGVEDTDGGRVTTVTFPQKPKSGA